MNLSKEEFERDFKLKDTNWFYKGMFDIWASFLKASIMTADKKKRALDLGCGAGGKTLYLKNFADRVIGLDLSIDALKLCKVSLPLSFNQGAIEALPYKDRTFSLVSAFDVLEHIEDDVAALKEINRVMEDDGYLVIALPAFKMLWSQHDLANFHKRRYRSGELREKLEKTGFKAKRISYANSILFIPALVQRSMQHSLLGRGQEARRTRVESMPGFLNSFLYAVLRFESMLIRKMSFPFGVALLCVAQKQREEKPMTGFLQKILRCPKCSAAFGPVYEEGLKSGDLICPNCASRYAVSLGIPRFLDHDISGLKKKTVRNFGYSWKTFPEFYDFYKEQFLDWIWPVGAKDIAGKVVLDAGCGSGRHIYQAVKLGAKEVVGFDLGEAIDVACSNTQEFGNVHLLQADIYNLPLAPVFDYIYCIGVLHHLTNPEEGFRRLLALLKRGGRISIWVYGKEGNFLVRKFMDPIRMHITSRMPMPLLYATSAPFALMLYVISKYIVRPLNSISLTRSFARLMPLNDYMNSISHFNFRAIFNIVFDQLVAAKTQYISQNEIESWFARAGLTDINITQRNRNGWRGTAVKAV